MAKGLISLDDLDNLSREELIERAKKFAKHYCVGDGKDFKVHQPQREGRSQARGIQRARTLESIGR